MLTTFQYIVFYAWVYESLFCDNYDHLLVWNCKKFNKLLQVNEFNDYDPAAHNVNICMLRAVTKGEAILVF